MRGEEDVALPKLLSLFPLFLLRGEEDAALPKLLSTSLSLEHDVLGERRVARLAGAVLGEIGAPSDMFAARNFGTFFRSAFSSCHGRRQKNCCSNLEQKRGKGVGCISVNAASS